MQAAQSVPKLNDIQAKIVAKQFDDALAELDDVLQADGQDAEALYMRAVCFRFQGKFENALDSLALLKRIAPEHGRAHQEEGHTLRDMGNDAAALIAYSRATRFNPALEASWKQQIRILGQAGRDKQANQIQAQLQYVQKLARPLVAVIDLKAQGKLLKAESLCRQYLQKVPHDVEGMRLLADIGVRLGALDDAEFLLESAHKLKPDNIPVHIEYIQTLRKRQMFARAHQEARNLLDTAPDNPQFQSVYAIECMQTGDYDTALSFFDAVLDRLPGDPVTLTSKGHAQKTCGRYTEAVEAYQSALASTPQHGEAYYALANLKVYRFGDNEIGAMNEQLANANLALVDHAYLNFALGKAYEDRSDFATSFEFYAAGNKLKQAQSRYKASRMTKELHAQLAVCTPEFMTLRAGGGYQARDPIFVVGLPRAGSTLLEQILSSHSQVDGTLELPNILSLSQRLRRREIKGESAGYPAILESLTDNEFEASGREYIEDTRIHRQDALFFIDKMPNNFRHIGLIQSILPNATIIDARRHPLACCFSGFKQLFADGQEFTYDLGDLGQYYRDYVELMDHWDDVLPGKVLRVQYEDVVADLDTQVRRILEHCGLEFESECVDFHRTERSVRTPSSEQVRQPIFKTGLDYWRNYENWLDPLKEALGAEVRGRYAIT